MMTRRLPKDAAEMTPDWLTHALRAGGAGDVTVTAANVSRIGQDQGFTGGALYRIAPSYGAAGSGPQSLVVKLSPTDPVLAARFFAANAREVAFYDRIAGQGALPAPQCYFAAVDPLRQASVIMLQDLQGSRSVPFLTGFSGADADALVDALVRVHSSWWDHPDLSEIDGTAIMDEFDFIDCWAQYPSRVADLLKGVQLPQAFVSLGDHLVANRARIFGDPRGESPLTRLHGDVQADNVVFDADGRAVLLDWQMTGKGRGPSDIAYALISSCAPATRRSGERDLIARYHRALCQQGVTGYGLDRCWQDYLRGAADKFLMTVIATVRFDNAAAHKIAWRGADLERLMAFCADHAIGPATFS